MHLVDRRCQCGECPLPLKLQVQRRAAERRLSALCDHARGGPPDDAQPIHSRQHGDPAILNTRHHFTQRGRLDHLDRIAPFVEMPSHFN